jgi:hypothetical protein
MGAGLRKAPPVRAIRVVIGSWRVFSRLSLISLVPSYKSRSEEGVLTTIRFSLVDTERIQLFQFRQLLPYLIRVFRMRS